MLQFSELCYFKIGLRTTHGVLGENLLTCTENTSHSSRSGGDEAATWTSYVGKMFSAASSYFPAQVSGMMSQDRAFATVHLLTSGRKNVCTLTMWAARLHSNVCVHVEDVLTWDVCHIPSRMQKLPRLLVATADGHLFIYNVDPLDGGECTLAHKHKWVYRPVSLDPLLPVLIQMMLSFILPMVNECELRGEKSIWTAHAFAMYCSI